MKSIWSPLIVALLLICSSQSMQHIQVVVKSHYSLDELELFCCVIDLRPQTQSFRTFRSTILSTRMKSQNLVKKNEILPQRMKSNASKKTEQFLNSNAKTVMASLHPRVLLILTADIEMGWLESHQQELPDLALYGIMRTDRCCFAAFARARQRRRPQEPKKRKRRVCSHQSRTSSENAFGPVCGGGFPRLSLLSCSPNVASHTAVSSLSRRLDALCASKCAGGALH